MTYQEAGVNTATRVYELTPRAKFLEFFQEHFLGIDPNVATTLIEWSEKSGGQILEEKDQMVVDIFRPGRRTIRTRILFDKNHLSAFASIQTKEKGGWAYLARYHLLGLPPEMRVINVEDRVTGARSKAIEFIAFRHIDGGDSTYLYPDGTLYRL